MRYAVVALVLAVSAVPVGWLAAQLVDFRDDFFGMHAVALALSIIVGQCLLALVLAAVSLRRGEEPRWVARTAIACVFLPVLVAAALN